MNKKNPKLTQIQKESIREKRQACSEKRLATGLGIVGLFLLIAFFFVLFLRIRYRDDYSHRTLSQAVGSSKTLISTPGNILDRNGIYLATSRKVYRLILDPKVLYETEESFAGSFNQTVKTIAEAFSLPEDEIRTAYEENRTRSYFRFRGGFLLEEKEKEEYDRLASEFNESKKKFNESAEAEDKIKAKIAGVWFEEEYRRSYPMSSVLSKIVGYTNQDSSEGLAGLEKQYQSLLHGTDGKEYTYIDEKGTITKSVTEQQDGYTLVTSLDSNVAQILQEEIAAFQEETGGNRINVAVYNPNDGTVIAMASDTDYDANDPFDLSGFFTEEELEHPEELFLMQEAYKGHPEKLEAMTQEEKLIALSLLVQSNFAISGTFEPGSTAKAMTLAMAIETKAVTDGKTFYCDGAIQVGKYCIHCHMDTVCGDLTPAEALGRSCNVCYVQIGQAVGRFAFAKYQERFNMGQKTNIDLPAEADTSALIYYEDGLNEIEISTCSFGQGFNVTMIQMLAVYSSLINGGYYYQPHVVTEIRDSQGNTIRKVDPVLVRQTVTKETSDYIREALRYVVTSGTANYVNLPGYTNIGKTGASEKLPRGTGKYVVSFIGASSMENPKFMIYVVIDEPHVDDQSMSRPAQELTAAILKRLLPYYNIYPDSEEDAFSYDWSEELNIGSESSHGEPAVEDPDEDIPWLDPSEILILE